MSRTPCIRNLALPLVFVVAVAGRAAAGDKIKPEAGPTVHGTVTALAADGKSITLSVPKNDGTKATEEKAIPLGAETVVLLADVVTKVKELPRGKLADLTPGTSAA